MILPTPQFYSSSGSRNSLPEDAEFASGLLETMRAESGAIPLLPLHLARFARCALADSFLLSQVKTAAEKIARATEHWPWGARVRFRYGVWQGTTCWDFSAVPLESVSAWCLGVHLICCETRIEPEAPRSPETRSGCAPMEAAGCKLLLRNLYQLAAAELSPGSPKEPLTEGLLLDRGGSVIETLRCNLLVRRDDRWLTPELSDCGVRGVMREWLASQIDIGEQQLTFADLLQADELAVCNGVRGVVPVVGLQGAASEPVQPVSIGPATRTLQQLVAAQLW